LTAGLGSVSAFGFSVLGEVNSSRSSRWSFTLINGTPSFSYAGLTAGPSPFSVHVALLMVKRVPRYQEWTEDVIRERAKHISNTILETWNFDNP